MKPEIFNDTISIDAIKENEDKSYTAYLSLNPNGKIFEGHFPNKPILPGVVMIEIFRVLSSKVTETSLRLAQAANYKFLSVIDPTETTKITADFSITKNEEGYKVSGNLTSKGTTYFKLKCILSEK